MQITEDEVKSWCSMAMMSSTESVAISRLTEILNGEYLVKEAREDILSFRPEKESQ